MVSLPIPAALAVTFFALVAPAPPPPAPAVTLTVAQDSASRWRMRIENTGNVPVRLMADARLLALEVTMPGAKKPLRCALPDDMRPASSDERGLVVPSQRTYSESFDPRTLCFGAAEAAALTTGATIVARLGWRPTKARKQTGPFEVEPLEGVLPAVGPLKELVAAPFTVAAVTTPGKDDGATPPAATAPPEGADDAQDASGLTVVSSEHADAERALDAGLTVTLINGRAHSISTLLRAETLAFEVVAPDGTMQRCGGTRAVDAPIRELYVTVPPKGRASTSVLLSQLCPPRTFDAAGYYGVTAIVDTRRASGRSVGLLTFDGKVTATKPTRLRIRHSRSASPVARPALD